MFPPLAAAMLVQTRRYSVGICPRPARVLRWCRTPRWATVPAVTGDRAGHDRVTPLSGSPGSRLAWSDLARFGQIQGHPSDAFRHGGGYGCPDATVPRRYVPWGLVHLLTVLEC